MLVTLTLTNRTVSVLIPVLQYVLLSCIISALYALRFF